MINKLSRYMESSGKTYQNHYVTILKWYEEDKDKLRQKGLNKKMNYDVGESLFYIIHDFIELIKIDQNLIYVISCKFFSFNSLFLCFRIN